MKRMTTAILLALAIPVQAEWVGGAGFTNISSDEDGIDVSLNTLGVSVGYRFGGDRFAFQPELKFGLGVNDDSVRTPFGDVDVEVHRFTAISLRGEYQFNQKLYGFVQPSWANLDLEVTAFGFSERDDEWNFGGGLGMGFRVTSGMVAELVYDRFDDTNVVTAGLKYAF